MKVVLLTKMNSSRVRYALTEKDYDERVDLSKDAVDIKGAKVYDQDWTTFFLTAKRIDWSLISDDIRMDVINTIAEKYEDEIYKGCKKDPVEENSWVYTLSKEHVKINEYILDAIKNAKNMKDNERILTNATNSIRELMTVRFAGKTESLIEDRFINTKTPMFCIDHISFHTAMTWYAKQHVKFEMNTKQIISQIKKEYLPKNTTSKKTKKKVEDKSEDVIPDEEYVDVIQQNAVERQDIETVTEEVAAPVKRRKKKAKNATEKVLD